MMFLALQVVAVLILAFLAGCVAGCWLSGAIARSRAAALGDVRRKGGGAGASGSSRDIAPAARAAPAGQ